VYVTQLNTCSKGVVSHLLYVGRGGTAKVIVPSAG
jgi:hypothetical protein